jgi:dTDP-4-amino-4,6-dideoxygalactose transaminase
MSNIVAGIGRVQLEVLDECVKARRVIFERYVQALGHIEGVLTPMDTINALKKKYRGKACMETSSFTDGICRQKVLLS